MRHGLPFAPPGLSVGLLGGSFDPAHAGHVHITLESLKRFRLDRVWWLVSPGNPLKARGPAALERRVARARELMRHPRVTVTDIEARLGTRTTAATLAALRPLYPRVRFVWLMGADNMVQLHLWDNWRAIVEGVPMGVLARPGMRLAARHSVAARAYPDARLTRWQRPNLARHTPPAWALINVPMLKVSSTEIRARGGWPLPGADVSAGVGPRRSAT